MILNDLFESRMSELDIEYQDWKNLEPVAFYSRYKMSKDQWASKHWSLIKGSQTVHEESQDDRNARIIAGEIEDAADQGNEQLVKQKIKELIRVGYTLDKDGRLQRMGMYEADIAEVFAPVVALLRQPKSELTPAQEKSADRDIKLLGKYRDKDLGVNAAINRLEKFKQKHAKKLEETFTRPETAREQQVQLLARTYAELYWGDRSITARASTAREIFNAVMSGELDTATLKMEIRALEQEQDISEEQDACYHKVKSRYKVWPSAYASGALVQCRKKGAANWGNKSKK